MLPPSPSVPRPAYTRQALNGPYQSRIEADIAFRDLVSTWETNELLALLGV